MSMHTETQHDSVQHRPDPGVRGVHRNERAMAFIFLSPCIAALLIAYLYPLLYSAYISLSVWDVRTPGAPIVFTGFENYGSVLENADFWSAARRSLVFTCVALPAELLLGTLVALMLTNETLNRRLAGLSRV